MINVDDTASVSLTVASRDTAVALGSGDVAVLGTPRIVALCEQAAVAAIADSLEETSTSVGTAISIDHLRATAVGATVTASAVVVAVDGKSISFTLLVAEGDITVASGNHNRYIVNRLRFEQATVTS